MSLWSSTFGLEGSSSTSSSSPRKTSFESKGNSPSLDAKLSSIFNKPFDSKRDASPLKTGNSGSPFKPLSTSFSLAKEELKVEREFLATEVDFVKREERFGREIVRTELDSVRRSERKLESDLSKQAMDTEILKADEEFLKSEMKRMQGQIAELSSQLAAVRAEVTVASLKENLSDYFEVSIKTHGADIEKALRAEHLEMRRELGTFSKNIESEMKSRFASDAQKEKALEAKLSQLKEESSTGKNQIAGLSKELNLLRADMDRESRERGKDLSLATETLRKQADQGDARIHKTMSDEHVAIRREAESAKKEASQLVQEVSKELKRALDSESNERNKGLERHAKQLDEEVRRLGQQVKEVAAKSDGLMSSLEAGLQTAAKEIHNVASEAQKDLQSALLDVKSFMTGRNASVDDAIKRLEQAHEKMHADLATHHGESATRSRAVEDNVQTAITELKSGWVAQQGRTDDNIKKLQQMSGELADNLGKHKQTVEGRHGKAEDLLKQLKQDLADVNMELGRHKNDSDRILQDVDAKVQRGMSDLKMGMDGRHEKAEAGLTRLQHIIGELSTSTDARHRSTDEGLQKLLSEQSVLHGDLKRCKAEVDSGLRDADANAQRAIKEIKLGIDGRHDKSEELIKKLQQAHKDLEGDLAKHQSDSAGALSRALDGEQKKRNDLLSQLQQAHLEMQAKIDKHKDDSDGRLKDADAKVLQAMAQLKADAAKRHDDQDDYLTKLQGELSNHKGDHDTRLRDVDGKLQQALAALKSDMTALKGDISRDMTSQMSLQNSEYDSRRRDADDKIQQALAQLKSEMSVRHDGHEDAFKQMKRDLEGEMSNQKGDHDVRLRDVDSKVQQAIAQLKTEMVGRHDGHEEAVAKLKAEMAGRHGGHDEALRQLQRAHSELQDSHTSRLGDAEALDAKVSQALAELRGDMAGRHDGHDNAVRSLQQAHAGLVTDLTKHRDDLTRDADRKVQQAMDALRSDLAGHKSTSDKLLHDADAKLQQAMAQLKGEMAGRHDGHEESMATLKQAHRDIQAELKSMIAGLQSEMAGSHNDHASTLRQLQQAHGQLQAELANHRGQSDARLQDADAKVQQALKELKADMFGRHDGHNDAVKKLQQAHQDILSNLEGHRQDNDARLRDVDAKVQQAMAQLKREMVGHNSGHEESLAKLTQAHAEIQAELANHKGDSNARLLDADTRIQQAMSELKGEMAGRHSGHDESLRQLMQAHADLQAELGSHKGDADTRLLDLDLKVQRALKNLQEDMQTNTDAKVQQVQRELVLRADGHDEAVRSLRDLHSDVHSQLELHRNKMGTEMQEGMLDLDSKVKRAIAELRSDFQEVTQGTERALRNSEASHTANHDFLSSAMKNMESNLTTYDAEQHSRVMDLRHHFDRALKDGLTDQEQQIGHTLNTMQTANDERHQELEQQFNRKLRETMTEIVTEHEELMQKMKSLNYEEQLKRVWEAIDTHTHDVNVDEMEEEETVSTKVIRPTVVVPQMVQRQRMFVPFGSQRVLSNQGSPIIGSRQARSFSPPALAGNMTPLISGSTSPRLSPMGGSINTEPALTSITARTSRRSLETAQEIVSTEKIHHHLDAHCGSAIFHGNSKASSDSHRKSIS